MNCKILDFLDIFNQSGNVLGICGGYYGDDRIHVGIYINYNNSKKIFHFINGEKILIEDIFDSNFLNYKFILLHEFDIRFLPTLISTAQLISNNKLNNFVFERSGTVYDGGKFEVQYGNFICKTGAEKFLNCGVFVFAFLKTFDYTLLDWDTWDKIDNENLIFLNEWLSSQNIPQQIWNEYYNKTRKIRGKHIFVSPLTESNPSIFSECEYISNKYLQYLGQRSI